MVKRKGATPGATLSATPGATPRQRPVNGGATYTPYTPSVAPALGGWVHAVTYGQKLVPILPFNTLGATSGRAYPFATSIVRRTTPRDSQKVNASPGSSVVPFPSKKKKLGEAA